MIFWALVFAVDMVAGDDVWEKEPKRRRRKDAMFAVLEVVAREGSFAGFCICGLDDGRDGEKRHECFMYWRRGWLWQGFGYDDRSWNMVAFEARL
jgi:hypothetical protein